jgi:glycosyltransferase involved in cell wall biosynthesis
MTAARSASVIICTRNRCASLAGTLQSLVGQVPAVGSLEIVVVDDGSKDDTEAVCRSFREKLPGLRYIASSVRGHLPAARNLGVRSARNEFLLFTDDDCVASPAWVESMSASLATHPIVAGAVDTSRDSFIEECHNTAQFHRFLPGRPACPEIFIAGANMGIRRSVIEALGGFSSGQRIASETEFVLRCRERGITAVFDPRSLVTHHPGRTRLSTALRYARDHSAVTIRLRRRFRGLLRTPRLLLVPPLLLLAAPLVAARVTTQIYMGNRRLLRRPHTLPLVFALKLASCWGAYQGLRAERSPTRSAAPPRD